MSDEHAGVALRSPQGRWVLVATILGSAVVQLDATVVNVGLPRIGANLHAGLAGLQWVVNGYALTLAALILLGGSLGDRLGRRRIFVLGVVWFAVASALCAAAPTIGVLVAARTLQGVGGAFLTPGSLAIIESAFRRDDRGAAVGAWSGLGGVASAGGPILGGLLVSAADWGWRLVFLINLPLAAVVVMIARKHIPETRDPDATGHLDVLGALLAAAGLAGLVAALTEGPAQRWPGWSLALLVSGAAVTVLFGLREAHTRNPMLPLDLFGVRAFTVTNLLTFVVYAALGGLLFLLPLQLQRGSGYPPVETGAALLPLTAVMLLLSARMGRLAGRVGPRPLLTAGPMLIAGGFVLMVRIGTHAPYATTVLPAALVLALGLSLTVAPLTATVLGAVPDGRAGIASAVNNTVSRAGGLVAVAVLPGLAGIGDAAYGSPRALTDGFHRAVIVAAGLCVLGGLVAGVGLRSQASSDPQPVRPTGWSRQRTSA